MAPDLRQGIYLSLTVTPSPKRSLPLYSHTAFSVWILHCHYCFYFYCNLDTLNVLPYTPPVHTVRTVGANAAWMLGNWQTLEEFLEVRVWCGLV